jgi:hypothetical protein
VEDIRQRGQIVVGQVERLKFSQWGDVGQGVHASAAGGDDQTGQVENAIEEALREGTTVWHGRQTRVEAIITRISEVLEVGKIQERKIHSVIVPNRKALKVGPGGYVGRDLNGDCSVGVDVIAECEFSHAAELGEVANVVVCSGRI